MALLSVSIRSGGCLGIESNYLNLIAWLEAGFRVHYVIYSLKPLHICLKYTMHMSNMSLRVCVCVCVFNVKYWHCMTSSLIMLHIAVYQHNRLL